ncbi:ATP-binding protein [Desulfosarcina ovata subsp. sediminis]|uniref:ATP-binding protein n=1 Tax=Desulfosarcina ovata subsp. sediminis TaxID=885957 RepID=A0A5K7ZL53_9BACT|nr:P-loop NTPase [Desulfosarcina ovata]BBO82114.1 ATP-binding protein [Desulfosarcina ovata subsp. sediminis]
MKIMICGKGGCGKSTITVLLAKAFQKKGYRVLVVDADESNLGIGRLLGTPVSGSLLGHLGGKKALQGKMMEAFPKGKPLELFTEKWKIEDIPADCLTDAGGIQLMPVGKIEAFGEGCACPMGVLSKMFLENLEAQDEDIVLIDSEAGVEHFGRGVEAGCDIIVGIVDPTYESVLLSQKMQAMAVKAERRIYFVLNKLNEQVEGALAGHMPEVEIIAKLPQKPDIFTATLEGQALDVRLPEIDELCEALLAR